MFPIMDLDQTEFVVECLIQFLEHATSKDATPEEIAALPEIVKLLLGR